MAIYISIVKNSESNTSAEYSYGDEPGRIGKLRIDKETGSITVLAEAPDDAESRMLLRAKRKLTLHWQNGELPDRTCWAS